jgi:WD40 repeat protein/DNA-binding winged helix-turn-helix (wHTH) protein
VSLGDACRNHLQHGETADYIRLKVSPQTETDELAVDPFRLGDWLAEPRLNRLTRDDESVQIELKMMDVLVCLASAAGELVTRQQIIDTVWATEFITEKTLTRAVAELRRTLGDDAKLPRYIETIHRRGYRLITPVGVVERPAAAVSPFPGRPPRAEDHHNPYPGLAAFAEDEAEFFFGREAEVAQLWRKITTRRLLAVIGPSGVGKSSLLRAGLIPASPEGWGVLTLHPGESPFRALGRALVPVFREDTRATAELLDIDTPDQAVALVSRWRGLHERALLIVDQFEELFTLNPPEIQARFAELLGRLARDADVHVLLSMRDDFLYRCHSHPPLRPILEDLTALQPPNRGSLRRALEQPAARLGFAFEDDKLVEGMLDEVTDERSALPLLAFAVARMWDARDRTRRLLTRQAFEDAGGVGGALARHAESILQAVGGDRIPLVRELFRNLVTAEGTRAVRPADDLLSVFPEEQRDDAADVLRHLVDARLLTSFQDEDLAEDGRHRIEVAHESLLANWPRLVGWRTQDADSARVRDQLRQAARTWHDHDRSDDVLWTGSAYREFAVWRERYPGGLTETEQDFADAMTLHAARRRRRRRTAVTATIILLLGVLAVIGGFWRRSVTEARRAEAANLFSRAQLQLEDHPSGAIAYSIASLELADSSEVRRLALEALWKGPTELRIPTDSPYTLDFSPDGRWLATAAPNVGAKLWPSDGGPPIALDGSDVAWEARISPTGDVVAANMDEKRQKLGFWSVPDGRFLRSISLGNRGLTATFTFSLDGTRLFTNTDILGRTSYELEMRSWPVNGGGPELLAHLELPFSTHLTGQGHDPTGSRLAWADGRSVRIAPLEGSTLQMESATSVEHDRAIGVHVFDKSGQRLATADTGGTVRIWSLEGDSAELLHTLAGDGGANSNQIAFDPSGSKLAGTNGLLWDLTAPPDAKPLRLRYPGVFGWGVAFTPDGRWLATNAGPTVSLWPLARTYPRVLSGHEEGITFVAFTPDGTQLVSSSDDGSVRIWPLAGSSPERSRTLYRVDGVFDSPSWLTMAPDGSFVVIGNATGRVTLLPLDGGPPRELLGFSDNITALAVGPESSLVAAGSGSHVPEQALVRVWDLDSGEVRKLDAGDGEPSYDMMFTRDGGLWVASGTKLRCWQPDGDPPRVVVDLDLSVPDGTEVIFDGLSTDDRLILLGGVGSLLGRLWIQDLNTHDSRELSSHAGRAGLAGLDPTGQIVISVDGQGGIRIGPVTGEEPHLLLGHEGDVTALAVSPDGRWIATGGEDSTIRLWPMPDLSRPPLHTLPRDELIARLKTLTNLRAVEDPDSPGGWKIEAGPFPGWDTVPEW